MTQTERILYRLNAGPMCSLEPLDWSPRITRPAARVQDLRDRGTQVISEPCELHPRKTSAHVVYRIPDQSQETLF